MAWSGGFVEWIEDGTAYISVVFSWQLQRAYSRSVYYRSMGLKVRAGGPAVDLNPGVLESVAELGGAVDALSRHNPEAVFTSRGCPNGCKFCAVPRLEGRLREFRDWDPRPVICDNNFLATSVSHVRYTVDRLLAAGIHGIDFNQGLEAGRFCYNKAEAISRLDLKVLRFAYDDEAEAWQIAEAIAIANRLGIPGTKIRVYVLIGYDDDPDLALKKCEYIKSLGAWPFPMRYQPLDAAYKNSYVAPGWTEIKLRNFIRYWSRLQYFGWIPFKDFDRARLDHRPLKDPDQLIINY